MTTVENALDAVWLNVSLPPVHAKLENIAINNGVTTAAMQEENIHSTSSATHELPHGVIESDVSTNKVVNASQHSEQVVHKHLTSSSNQVVSGSAENRALENASYVVSNDFSNLNNSNAFQVENGINDNKAEVNEAVPRADSHHSDFVSHIVEHIPAKNEKQDLIVAELKELQRSDCVEYLSDDETLKGSDDDNYDHQHQHHELQHYTEVVTYDVPPPEPPLDYDSDTINIMANDEPQNIITELATNQINTMTKTSHALSHHSSHTSVNHGVPLHHSSRDSLHKQIPSHHTSHSALQVSHAEFEKLQSPENLSLSSLPGSPYELSQRPDSRTSTTSEARGVREVPIIVKDIKKDDSDAFFTSKLSYNKQDVHTIREYGVTGRTRHSSTSTLRDFEEDDHKLVPQTVQVSAQNINSNSNNINSDNTLNKVVKTPPCTTYNYNNKATYPQIPRETFAAVSAAANVANSKNRNYTKHSEHSMHSPGYTNVPKVNAHSCSGQSYAKVQAYAEQPIALSRSYSEKSEVKSHAHIGHSEVNSYIHNSQADPDFKNSSGASSRRQSLTTSSTACPVCHGTAPKVFNKLNKADSVKADIAKTTIREAGKYDSIRVVKSVRSYKDFLNVFNQHELDEDDPIEYVTVPKPRYSISGRSSSLKASDLRTNQFLNHRPILLPSHNVFENNLVKKRSYASQQLYENHKHASNNSKLDRATSYHCLPDVVEDKHSGTILTIHEGKEYTPFEGRSPHMSHTETNEHIAHPANSSDTNNISVGRLCQIFEDSRVNSRRTSAASIVSPTHNVKKAATQHNQVQQYPWTCPYSSR